MKAIIKTGKNVGVGTGADPALRDPIDVLIQVAVAGLCRTDIHVAEDRIKTKDPLILGHEFSGIVADVGPEVDHVRVGDRVAVMPFVCPDEPPRRDRSYANATMLGIHHDGAFAEYISVPKSLVHRLPDRISLLEGAYMEPVAASLGVLDARIQPDQKGLIYGDNRISRLTERVLRAKGFSDVEVFEPNAEGPTLSRDTYDFIVETLATTETMTEIVHAVKPGGCIVLKSRQHSPVAFNINTLVMKQVTLQAVSYGDFAMGIDLVASGALRVDDLFGDVFPFEQFETVFERSRSGESQKLFLSGFDRHVWSA